MVGRKRKQSSSEAAVPDAPDAPESRRRSQRASTSAKKSRYFESESGPRDADEDKPAGARKKPLSGGQGNGAPRLGRWRPRKAVTGGQKKARTSKETLDEDEDGDEDGDGDGDGDGDEEDDGDEYKADDDDDDGDGDSRDAKDKENGDDDNNDDDEDDNEDAGARVVFKPLPKLRDEGGIAYREDRLHPNTLLFLKDLHANNKRSWLQSHDPEYRRSLKDWEAYVETMTQKVIAADETIPELPFKDINFRIYRDIRFSKDPTPYKAHYSAAWSRTGRKGNYACYYVHVEPGKCFIGGGLWHPGAESVNLLRASIDERPQRWRRVLTDPAFRRTFLPKAGAAGKGGEKAERAALKAFAEANAEGALKTKPKGYNPDHWDIELLKLKSYTVGKKVPDNVFTKEGGQDEIAGIVRAMVGFITHLNRIVRPDPGDDDGGDGEDEEMEDDGEDE